MKPLGLQLHTDELDELPADAKMILAAACTQRHSLNYHAFAGGSGTRRSKRFDVILDAIWRDIGYNQLSREELDKMQVRAERLIPGDVEECPSAHIGYGQLAAEALTLLVVAMLKHGDSNQIWLIAKRSFHSIWSFLPEVYSAWRTSDGFLALDADVRFTEHRLALEEHHRQERDLSDVKRMLDERRSVLDIVEELRNRSRREGLFPIM